MALEAEPQSDEVAITSPTDGATISGIVTVDASAAGSSPLVKLVYYLDDVLLAVTEPPAPLAGDSANVPNGPHTLTVSGFDAAGNVEQSVVTFTIAN